MIAAADQNEALRYLREVEFDPRRSALVVSASVPSLAPSPRGAFEYARILEYRPNDVVLEARCESRCLVVLTDLFYPGWTVEVDEVSAERRLAPEVRAWDPPAALYSGKDELAFFDCIFAETPPLLWHGADMVLEVGDGQAERVLDLGARYGFIPLDIRNDLAGTPRAVLLTWKGG